MLPPAKTDHVISSMNKKQQ